MAVALSVIIPVYNSADYLNRCLDSVIGQTFAFFELILVNDGSVDASGEICERYAAADPRVRVFHQQNGGPGRARNLGLDVAQGTFIALIDADDWLEETFLERLLGASHGQDLVVCGYVREHPTHSEPRLLGRGGAIDRALLLEHTFCSSVMTPGCWNKLLRRDLLDSVKLRFEPEMPWGDDMLFLARYYLLCKHIVYVNDALYHYRLNPHSLMKAVYTKRQFNHAQGRILNALDAMQGCFDQTDLGEAEVFAYRQMRSSIRLLLHLAICRYRDDELLAGIGERIKAVHAIAIGTSHAGHGERVASTIVCISPVLAFRCAMLVTLLLPGWVRRQLG